jgi:hypothetical protein
MADSQAAGVEGRRRQQVRTIAVYQKGVIICVLIQFLVPIGVLVLVGVDAALPWGAERVSYHLHNIALLLALLLVPAVLAAMVLAILLSLKVYGNAIGILLAALMLVPCLGLLVFLLVNYKATSILRENGHRVGLLGARLSEFEDSFLIDRAFPHPDPLREGEREKQLRERR